MTRGKFPGWVSMLDPDPLQVEPEPAKAVVPRRGCLYWVLACVVVLAASLSNPVPLRAEEPPVNVVGPASYTASATWCAPTPKYCTDWGGNARLAAVNSFTWGDEPYPVRVWRGDIYVDVTVVSFCACHGQHGYIDLSPAAFEVLAPLSRGRIDVSVEVLVDLPPHPDDERMRAEDGPQVTTPPTDAAEETR